MRNKAKDNIIDARSRTAERTPRRDRAGKGLIIGSAVVLLIALISGIVAVFAWFAANNSSQITVAVDDFKVVPVIYQDSEWIEISDSAQATASSFDPFAASRSLVVSLKATGRGNSYIRVRTVESFYAHNDRTSALPVSNVPVSYLFDTANWKLHTDGYYYYKNIITEPTAANSYIAFITGVDGPEPVQNKAGVIDCSVSFVVEAVQPDRFDEFFGTSYESVFGS